MRSALPLCVIGWIGLSTMGPAVAGLDHGAQVAAACAPCHRLDAQRAGTPPIVGLDADRLIGMMRVFRSNDTPNHIMHAVSLSLSDDELAAVAQYLSALGKDAKQP